MNIASTIDAIFIDWRCYIHRPHPRHQFIFKPAIYMCVVFVNAYNFSAWKFGSLGYFPYICNRFSQSALCGLLGQILLDKCFASVAHRSFRNSAGHIRSTKGRFQNVIFYIQNFATFGFYWKIPQRSVHVRCIIFVCLKAEIIIGSLLHTPHYNTRWRGLTELLITVERAMRRPRMWGKRRKVYSHVFLFPILYY